MLLPIASSESIDGNQNVVSTRSKSLGRVVSTETHGLHAQVDSSDNHAYWMLMCYAQP